MQQAAEVASLASYLANACRPWAGHAHSLEHGHYRQGADAGNVAIQPGGDGGEQRNVGGPMSFNCIGLQSLCLSRVQRPCRDGATSASASCGVRPRQWRLHYEAGLQSRVMS